MDLSELYDAILSGNWKLVVVVVVVVVVVGT